MAKEDLNRCEFIGRLGADPETRVTTTGKTVSTFRIAVNGYNDDVQWVPMVTWGKLAEIVGKYLFKGSQIYIAGRWQTREWEDKNGGKRYTTEIVAREMKMLGGKSEQNKPAGEENYKSVPVTDDKDDDIPF